MTDTFLYLLDVARESPALEESEGDGPITFKTPQELDYARESQIHSSNFC